MRDEEVEADVYDEEEVNDPHLQDLRKSIRRMVEAQTIGRHEDLVNLATDIALKKTIPNLGPRFLFVSPKSL